MTITRERITTAQVSPNRTGLYGRWQRAWRHELARYYRARQQPYLTPWLGAVGVLLVWGLFLCGTALGVATYPQATHVKCNWYGCNYPLVPGNPLLRLNALFSEVLFAGLCLSPAVLLVVVVVRVFFRQRQSAGPQPATLANSWRNRAIEMMLAAPLYTGEIVRIRFLCRLHRIWQQRALVAVVTGTIAAVIVSQHVIYPIFWWLGPWRQWAVQLALVLAWIAAVVVWLVAAAAFATLNEVTYGASEGAVGFNWGTITAFVFLLMVVTPLLMPVALYGSVSGLSYHQRNTMMTVSAPLIIMGVGAVLALLNYVLAQGVFRLRIRAL